MSRPSPNQKESTSPASHRVDLERGTLRGWQRAAMRWMLLQLIRPWISLTIEGIELVPKSGAFLFVANHLHNADPVLLEMALPRAVHLMAKQELFRNPILGWLVRRTGAFPVDRGRADRAAIRQATALLANGVPVGMFPEGTRSKTGMLQEAFPGAGLIALQSGAPILPAAIVGTEVLPLNGTRPNRPSRRRRPIFRRHRVTIRFGPLCSVPGTLEGRRVTAAQASAMMMCEIARLLPASYRGVYADACDGTRPVAIGAATGREGAAAG